MGIRTVTEAPPQTTPGAAPPAGRTQRYRELARLLFKYGGREIVDRLKLGSFLGDSDSAVEARATELADDLERLGPTYIKLGQILSTRSDLLPPQVLEQLSRLQDRVTPMPADVVKTVVETELGRPINEIFQSFEETPIGSASLGQVHAAKLLDGRLVAVKVQRPGIQEVIAQDVNILRELSEFLEKRTETARRYQVTAVIDEFNAAMTRELDYEIEAENMRLLKRNLAEFERIVVPAPVGEYCTRRVLTMEFVTGRKVSAIGPLIQNNMNGAPIADQLLKAYLKQVFVDGFFHADPHPGNVFLVDSDHVALLDLGLMGRFSGPLRRKLLQMLPAIYEMDAEEMVDLSLEIGDANETFDRAELKRRYAEIAQESQTGSLKQIQVSR
ncbi:MAG: AarF/ABC1/UbiB kinase family protein, partial [Elusimicrobia bacterium]|nr:AarF/ABC1/UbiB kinase family protein [Elusimicrobiota bacterium]